MARKKSKKQLAKRAIKKPIAARKTPKPKSPREKKPAPSKTTPRKPAPRTPADALARSREAKRLSVARDRATRIKEFRETVARSRAARGTLPIRIFAEGDSWFDFPRILNTGGGTITHLEDQLNADILNLAHAGDEAIEMLSLGQRERIEQLLADDSLNFNAMLFSGGGNDIVGDRMCLWLRDSSPTTSPASALDTRRLASALDMVEIAYHDLVAMRDRLRPACHLFLHCYDFPLPTGRGVCNVGPWLKPSLDYRGWTMFADQCAIMRQMLEEFAKRLKLIEATSMRCTLVMTQGLLDANVDWHDELHPDRSGFRKVAGAFKAAIIKVFPQVGP